MSSNVQEIERSAIAKLKEGDLPMAIELFKQAILQGSQNFSCRFLLSRSLLELERGVCAEFTENCELISQINEISYEKIYTHQESQRG